MQGNSVSKLFRKQPEKYWNVIDCDARLNSKTKFTMPKALKEVSLNEIYKKKLHESTYTKGDKVANYLLVSQGGAVTLWHTDFSGTSVFYALVKGCKVFYLIRPTPNNVQLWESFLSQPRRDVFFGSHPDLDGGGCQKVVLTERLAVCMPAGMIHCVETIGTSIAFGELAVIF